MLFARFLPTNCNTFRIDKQSFLSAVFFLLLMCLLIFSSCTTAMTVDVNMSLDQHDIVYTVEPNGSFEYVVQGNVTCEFEGVGKNLQYIEVQLLTTCDYYFWSTEVFPAIINFQSNGKKSINVTINIPSDVLNQTENRVTVTGNWQTRYFKDSSLAGASGDLDPEEIYIKINRKILVTNQTAISSDDGEPTDLVGIWGLSIVILAPIMLILIIIMIFYYKNKKWKE